MLRKKLVPQIRSDGGRDLQITHSLVRSLKPTSAWQPGRSLTILSRITLPRHEEQPRPAKTGEDASYVTHRGYLDMEEPCSRIVVVDGG